MAAWLCRHLLQGTDMGFSYDRSSEQTWPDAWCQDCGPERAPFREVCTACYERIRARNWREDAEVWARLVDEGLSYLGSCQQRLAADFRLGEHARYDVSQDTGALVFSQDGLPRVTAEVQFVGTISNQTRTWLWSWANDSIRESVRRDVRQLRRLGEDQHLLRLACAHWPAEEADGWEMAAIAAQALGAAGAYRVPGGTGFTFLVLSSVRWVQ